MQVFKIFFKIAWKYRISLLLYFGICVFVTFMVAAQYGDSKKEVKYGNESYHIAVVDKDQSVLSKAVVSYLKEQHNVEEKEYDKDLVKDLIYYQEISAYVTIPEGFEKNHMKKNPLLVESLSDDGQAAGVFINMQLSSYLESVVKFEKSGFSLEDAVKHTKKSVDFKEFVTMEQEDAAGGKETGETNSKLYSLFLFLPYPVMAIILSCIMPVVLLFRKKEIKNRMSISAVSISSQSISLTAGGAVVSFLVFLGLLTFTSCFLKEDVFHEKWLYAAINLFVFTIVTVMLMIFLVSFSFAGIRKSKDIVTNIVALGFSFLGGIFVPLSLLGDGVKAVGKFLPTYWYAVSLEKIDEGMNFSDISGGLLLQLFFGAVCLIAGVIIMNYKKSSAD